MYAKHFVWLAWLSARDDQKEKQNERIRASPFRASCPEPMASAPVDEVHSSPEFEGEQGIVHGPVRSNRRYLLLLDSEYMRCRRAAVVDISGDVRAGRIFRSEDTAFTIARIRSEYEAVDWKRTSLLWPGTRRLRRQTSGRFPH